MTDLLDVIDELTLVQNSRERQEVLKDGKVAGFQTVTVTQPPLLEQLDEAIRSSMGGSTAGASLPHEASPLDTDALFKFIKIESQIRDWCRNFRVPVAKEPVDNLRAWHAATLAKGLEPAVETFYVKALRGWVGLIRSKLDPWREKDLPDACPICGATSWWLDGSEYYRPLIIRYKPDEDQMVSKARASCRACETVWNVRELAYAIEQAEENAHEGA